MSDPHRCINVGLAVLLGLLAIKGERDLRTAALIIICAINAAFACLP